MYLALAAHTQLLGTCELDKEWTYGVIQGVDLQKNVDLRRACACVCVLATATRQALSPCNKVLLYC